MKKIILLSLFCNAIFSSQNISAQAVNIKVYGGYSWPGLIRTGTIKSFQPGNNPEPTAASIIDMRNIIDTGSTNKVYRPIKGSYGQGGSIGIGFGYMFNKWIGVELNAVYLFGNTIQSSELSNASPLLGPKASTIIKTKANGLSVIPAINIVAAVDKWIILPYARLGLSVPVLGSITHIIDIEAPKPNAALFPTAKSLTTHVEVKTDATLSLGFTGALGISYQPQKNIKIFAEMNGQVLDVRAKKTTVEKYVIVQTDANGVKSDYYTLDNFPNTYSREVVYVDQMTESSNNPQYNTTVQNNYHYDETKAKNELRPTAPFSNVGFSIGLTYVINTAKKTKVTTP